MYKWKQNTYLDSKDKILNIGTIIVLIYNERMVKILIF